MRKTLGQTALAASLKVLTETEDRLKSLLMRGDLSADVQDERTTINWLMRVRAAKQKARNALRKMS